MTWRCVCQFICQSVSKVRWHTPCFNHESGLRFLGLFACLFWGKVFSCVAETRFLREVGVAEVRTMRNETENVESGSTTRRTVAKPSTRKTRGNLMPTASWFLHHPASVSTLSLGESTIGQQLSQTGSWKRNGFDCLVRRLSIPPASKSFCLRV